MIAASEDTGNKTGKEDTNPPSSIIIAGETRKKEILLPRSQQQRRRMANEEKRIIRLTKKEDTDHVSSINTIETMHEGRGGSSLLDCRDQGGRRRRRPLFSRSLQSWLRTRQREHNPPLPSSITLMNAHSRRRTTKDEEADCPPQLPGLKKRMGNEKMALLLSIHSFVCSRRCGKA